MGITAEAAYNWWCETVGGGLFGHPHWDDLTVNARRQWERFTNAVALAEGRSALPVSAGSGATQPAPKR